MASDETHSSNADDTPEPSEVNEKEVGSQGKKATMVFTRETCIEVENWLTAMNTTYLSAINEAHTCDYEEYCIHQKQLLHQEQRSVAVELLLGFYAGERGFPFGLFERTDELERDQLNGMQFNEVVDDSLNLVSQLKWKIGTTKWTSEQVQKVLENLSPLYLEAISDPEE